MERIKIRLSEQTASEFGYQVPYLEVSSFDIFQRRTIPKVFVKNLTPTKALELKKMVAESLFLPPDALKEYKVICPLGVLHIVPS